MIKLKKAPSLYGLTLH